MVPLHRPTCDTAAITQPAVLGLQCLFEPGFDLAKAGGIAMELGESSLLQGELAGRERSKPPMPCWAVKLLRGGLTLAGRA